MNFRPDFEDLVSASKNKPWEKADIYYGIYDNLGLDVIYKLDSNSPNDRLTVIDLRCRYNTSRNPMKFALAIDSKVMPNLKKMKDPDNLLSELKRRAIKFVEW